MPGCSTEVTMSTVGPSTISISTLLATKLGEALTVQFTLQSTNSVRNM